MACTVLNPKSLKEISPIWAEDFLRDPPLWSTSRRFATGRKWDAGRPTVVARTDKDR